MDNTEELEETKDEEIIQEEEIVIDGVKYRYERLVMMPSKFNRYERAEIRRKEKALFLGLNNNSNNSDNE